MLILVYKAERKLDDDDLRRMKRIGKTELTFEDARMTFFAECDYSSIDYYDFPFSRRLSLFDLFTYSSSLFYALETAALTMSMDEAIRAAVLFVRISC